jgi:hypothetical protein
MSNTFTPSVGNRVLPTTTTSANITIAIENTNAFMFDNTSGNVIFVSVGTGLATIPTGSNIGNGIMINHDDSKVLYFPNIGSSTPSTVVISGIAASGTGNLFITPGVV